MTSKTSPLCHKSSAGLNFINMVRLYATKVASLGLQLIDLHFFHLHLRFKLLQKRQSHHKKGKISPLQRQTPCSFANVTCVRLVFTFYCS